MSLPIRLMWPFTGLFWALLFGCNTPGGSVPESAELVNKATLAAKHFGPVAIRTEQYEYPLSDADQSVPRLRWYSTTTHLRNDPHHVWTFIRHGVSVQIYVQNGDSLLSYDLTHASATYRIVESNPVIDERHIVSSQYLDAAVKNAEADPIARDRLAAGRVTSESYDGVSVWRVHWDVSPSNIRDGSEPVLVNLVVQKSDGLARLVDAYDPLGKSIQREEWHYRPVDEPFSGTLFSLRPPIGFTKSSAALTH